VKIIILKGIVEMRLAKLAFGIKIVRLYIDQNELIMKLQKLIYAILFLFLVGSVSAQVKDAKSNSDKEIVETGKIPNLLNSRTFEFIANTVFPASGTPQNLVGGNYSVRFYPELIISDLPFLGRVYSGMTMQKDRGMRFQGNPEK